MTSSKLKNAMAVAALTATLGSSSAANAAGTDVVIVTSLNYGYASCNPIKSDYWHYATMTVYKGAIILCQATLAYITYDDKGPFT